MKIDGVKLLIRADATTGIGTGHVMRCIALAETWQNHGGKVVFVSHCESQVLQNRIIDEGFDLIPIKNPHPHPDDLKITLDILQRYPLLAPLNRVPFQGVQSGCSELSAAKQERHAPCSKPHALSPWLILDGYHFTPEYQKAIRDAGIRLLVIDDMNHLPHYHADILLNQNIDAEQLHYSCGPEARLLLGTKYVLLRKEFWPWQEFKREIPEVARKILVTLGGGDPDNVTLRVIEAIKLLNMPELEVKVIVGPLNPHLAILRDSMLSAPCPMRFIQNVCTMPELMAWADVAISAGGSTCWELAFMKVPFITLVLADNQKSLTSALEQAGVCLNLGWHENTSIEDISHTVKRLLFDRKKCKAASERVRNLVDGRGGKRVIGEMAVSSIILRRAQEEDCLSVWKWANDPVTRIASFRSDPIPWETHQTWFLSKLRNSNCIFYIATGFYDEPVGQVRFDIEEDKAVISMSLCPKFRGYGLGHGLIRKACDEVLRERRTETIHALIKMNNPGSIRVFEEAGFRKIQETIHENQMVIVMSYN